MSSSRYSLSASGADHWMDGGSAVSPCELSLPEAEAQSGNAFRTGGCCHVNCTLDAKLIFQLEINELEGCREAVTAFSAIGRELGRTNLDPGQALRTGKGPRFGAAIHKSAKTRQAAPVQGTANALV